MRKDQVTDMVTDITQMMKSVQEQLLLETWGRRCTTREHRVTESRDTVNDLVAGEREGRGWHPDGEPEAGVRVKPRSCPISTKVRLSTEQGTEKWEVDMADFVARLIQIQDCLDQIGCSTRWSREAGMSYEAARHGLATVLVSLEECTYLYWQARRQDAAAKAVDPPMAPF